VLIFLSLYREVWNYFLGQFSGVLKLEKKVIRVICVEGFRDSCIGRFRKLDILSLSYEYILSLMLFMIDNQNNFPSGLEMRGLNTRSKNQPYFPI
jgi:hypothetical protein